MEQKNPKLQGLTLKSLKRTHEIFLMNDGRPLDPDHDSQKIKISCKIFDEYNKVKDLPPPSNFTAIKTQTEQVQPMDTSTTTPTTQGPVSRPDGALTDETVEENTSAFQNIISSISESNLNRGSPGTGQIVAYRQQQQSLIQIQTNKSGDSSSGGILTKFRKRPKPVWHPPWKLMRVIAGHVGWVRSVAIEPGNEWFCTGSADRTIKLWDLASGTLKITLTGHVATVRGIVVSHRHNYIFSCGEDKMVKCWDLVRNKVIRHYHGHLSGVYCVSLHPTLDVLCTGGRDGSVRVWDIRTKAQIHLLSGHTSSVASLVTQSSDPQVVSGSHDNTIRLWDLGAGRTMSVLTNHKKSIRSLALHPQEFCFASAGADNIKKWKFPEGIFMQNLSGHNAIVNTLALNQDNVLFSGADNGSMSFWDWKSGYNFQTNQTIPQPGSLESEAGIFASAFDLSGSRLITCEADKTVKIWKEDDTATPETHPINPTFRPDESKF